MLKHLAVFFASLITVFGGLWGVFRWMGIDPFTYLNTSDARIVAEAPRPRYYVDLAPVTVPLLQGDQRVATLLVSVKLEAIDAASEEMLIRQLPRLSDAYLKDLFGYLPRTLRARNQIDQEELETHLLEVGERALKGPKLISDLSVVVEMIKYVD